MLRLQSSYYRTFLVCEVLDKLPLLHNSGNYVALSYAAGSHEETTEILVDGLVFRAFSNLVHGIEWALHHLRERHGGDRQLPTPLG